MAKGNRKKKNIQLIFRLCRIMNTIQSFFRNCHCQIEPECPQMPHLLISLSFQPPNQGNVYKAGSSDPLLPPFLLCPCITAILFNLIHPNLNLMCLYFHVFFRGIQSFSWSIWLSQRPFTEMSDFTGCKQFGSEAEEEDLWHYQRVRRSGIDWEEKQEHNPVEVWCLPWS